MLGRILLNTTGSMPLASSEALSRTRPEIVLCRFSYQTSSAILQENDNTWAAEGATMGWNKKKGWRILDHEGHACVLLCIQSL